MVLTARAIARPGHDSIPTEGGRNVKLGLSGFGFLLAYILTVGVASFLEKFSMKQLNAYQVNFLMAIGMAITAVPALWLKQGNLTVPNEGIADGCSHRAFDGAWIDLFCASTREASSRHGNGSLHQLRRCGRSTFSIFPQ
jgi:hypothetical protein